MTCICLQLWCFKKLSPVYEFSIKKNKKCIKKDDISTETQTARGGHENIQFNVNAETATEQQANSSKQRQTKKHTSEESEEEIEDALNLMFDYSDKKFEGMQAQIEKKTCNLLWRNINHTDTT